MAALCHAVRHDNREQMKMYLEQHPVDTIKLTELLVLAVRDKLMSMVELLLKHGADPNKRDEQSLVYTARDNNKLVMNMLNHTVLMHAVMNRSSSMVELLLKHGTDPNETNGQCGQRHSKG